MSHKARASLKHRLAKVCSTTLSKQIRFSSRSNATDAQYKTMVDNDSIMLLLILPPLLLPPPPLLLLLLYYYYY